MNKKYSTLFYSLLIVLFTSNVGVFANDDKQPSTKNSLPSNDQELSKHWQWVRHHKGCHHFKNGKLLIKSLPGNIYENHRPPSQNILLTAFKHKYACITLKVSLKPDKHGEQAGLLFYRDDNHYVKLVKEWYTGPSWRGQPNNRIGKQERFKDHSIISVREQGNKAQIIRVFALDEEIVHLRFVKMGDRVVSYARGDSEKKFKYVSDTALPSLNGKPLKLGLLSSGANSGVDHWATFHSLTIVPIDEKANPLGFTATP